jgi:hypothetical protein
MRAMAASPSRPGIARSVSTTSGLQRASNRQQFLAVAGLVDHLHVRHQLQQRLDAAPHDVVVVRPGPR